MVCGDGADVLYRRLSMLGGQEEIEAFAAELIDRFGQLPQEVENLLEVIAVKQLCRIEQPFDVQTVVWVHVFATIQSILWPTLRRTC